MKLKILLFVSFLLMSPILFAQEDRLFNLNPDQYDLNDLIIKIRHKEASEVNKDSVDWSETHWSIFPAIAINPAIGTGYGFGITAGKYLGDPKTTRISALSSTPIYTTNNQLFIPIRLTAYTKDENYFLNGTYIWRHFPLGTYGLGSNTTDWQGDMIDSNTITFWQTVNKKVGDGIFIGGGYALDYYYKIHDTRAEIITDYIGKVRNGEYSPEEMKEFLKEAHEFYKDNDIPPPSASEIASLTKDLLNPSLTNEFIQEKHISTVYQDYYTEKFGKSVNEVEDVKDGKEISSSFMLNFIIDKRDNQLNPYEGIYFNAYARLSYKWIGSTTNYTFLAYDYRQYWEMPWLQRNLFSIWATGAFTFGDPVYTGLPAIASDPFLRTGRGWTAGRLKGMDMMYFEAEYRIPVYNLIGAVVFVNSSQFSDMDRNFGELQLGYGLGLRMKLNKQSRSNFALDFGWNERGYAGFYMQLNETF